MTGEQEIIEIINKIHGTSFTENCLNQTLTDLGLDSLDVVTLAMEVEKYYDVLISDEELEKINTPRDFVKAIENKLFEQ